MTESEKPKRTSGVARLLNEVDACGYLGVSRSFLARARMDGPREGRTPGPPFVKLGRAVRYAIEDLDAYIASNRHEPGRISAERKRRGE